jgi:hypothetical protein
VPENEELRDACGIELDLIFLTNDKPTMAYAWTGDDRELTIVYYDGKLYMVNPADGSVHLHYENVLRGDPDHDPTVMDLDEIMERTGMVMSATAPYVTTLFDDGWQGPTADLVKAARSLHRVNTNLA